MKTNEAWQTEKFGGVLAAVSAKTWICSMGAVALLSFGCASESVSERAYKNCKSQMQQMSEGVAGLDVGFESICQGVKKRCEVDPKDSFCTQYSGD